MTPKATICFLSSRETLKERQLKAFAASFEAHAVRATSLEALRPCLEKHKPGLLVVDSSQSLARHHLAGFESLPVLAHLGQKKAASLPLSLLGHYAAVCFSAVPLSLDSPLLRYALHALTGRAPPQYNFGLLLGWGAAHIAVGDQCPPSASFIAATKVPTPLCQFEQTFAAYVGGNGSVGKGGRYELASDGQLWGQWCERQQLVTELAWQEELAAIESLPNQYKLLHFQAGASSYMVAAFDKLTIAPTRGSDPANAGEFMIVHPAIFGTGQLGAPVKKPPQD